MVLLWQLMQRKRMWLSLLEQWFNNHVYSAIRHHCSDAIDTARGYSKNQ